MPRGKRSSAATKFTALDVVIEYLPERTQARFRCVSHSMNDRVSKSIKPPIYASLIEELQEHANSIAHPTDGKTCVYVDGETMGMELLVKDNGKRVQIYMGFTDDDHWQIISTCLKQRVKFILYRMIQKGKQLKRTGIPVEDVISGIYSDCAEVMTIGDNMVM